MFHDFQIGELLVLTEDAEPLREGTVVQVAGFRGDSLLRVLPFGGTPLPVPYDRVRRTGLPSGNRIPPVRRRPRRPARASGAAGKT